MSSPPPSAATASGINRASVVVDSSLLCILGVVGRWMPGSEAAGASSPGCEFMMCRLSPASRGLPGEMMLEDAGVRPVDAGIDSWGAFGPGASCRDDAEDSQLNFLFSLGTGAGWLAKVNGGLKVALSAA